MKYTFGLILLILLLVFLRFYKIDQKNLWFDEVYSWHLSFGDEAQIISDTSGDIHPPLFYIVLKYWIKLFSDSITSMRILSVIFSLAAFLYLVSLLNLLQIKKPEALLILFLYSVSPLNIYYSQEVRMLSLNLLLCTASIYYFYSLIIKPQRFTGLKYVVFTFLALYTHYFSLLIIFSEFVLIFILYKSKKTDAQTFRKFVFVLATSLILFLPWFPVFIRQSLKGQPWRSEQSLFKAGVNVVDYVRDIFFSPYFTFESMTISYLSAFTAIITLTLIFYSVIKIWNKGNFFSDISVSIVFFFLIPLFTAYIISLKQSIVLSRYLSITVPYLIASLVILTMKSTGKTISFLILLFFIFTSLLGVKIYFGNEFKNNDYRKIISFIESNYKEGDKIIVEPHFMGWAIDYHIKHSESVLNSPEVLGWNLKMQIDSLSKRTDLEKVWIVTDYSSLDKNDYDSLRSVMSGYNFESRINKSFYIIPSKVKVEYFTLKK